MPPAMGFYGTLGDLLATAAMGDRASADEIHIGIALDSWRPTLGTRLTGQRSTAARLVITSGKLAPLGDPPATSSWTFPEMFDAPNFLRALAPEHLTFESAVGR
jgi:hypothetical protein